MNFESLLFEADGEIAIVTINRPEKLNALNETVISELDACFDLDHHLRHAQTIMDRALAT